MMEYPSISDLSMQNEKWEYVSGFNQRYMVSNFGRFYPRKDLWIIILGKYINRIEY